MKTNDETNNANEHNMVKNPNWQEADYLQTWLRSWTGVYQETTPAKWVSECQSGTRIRDLRIQSLAP